MNQLFFFYTFSIFFVAGSGIVAAPVVATVNVNVKPQRQVS